MVPTVSPLPAAFAYTSCVGVGVGVAVDVAKSTDEGGVVVAVGVDVCCCFLRKRAGEIPPNFEANTETGCGLSYDISTRLAPGERGGFPPLCSPSSTPFTPSPTSMSLACAQYLCGVWRLLRDCLRGGDGEGTISGDKGRERTVVS